MKPIKNYLIALAVIATLAGSAYNTTLNRKQTEMSMLNLANITTLANAEKPNGEKYLIQSPFTCQCYRKENYGIKWPTGKATTCITTISFSPDTTKCVQKGCPSDSSCN